MEVQLSSRSCRGFSMLELVLVVLITGILILLAVSRFSDVQPFRSRIGAKEIAAHIRFARNIALYRELPTRVVISVESNSYAVFVGDTNTPPLYSAVSDPLTRGPLSVSLEDRFAELRVLSVDVGGGATFFFSSTNGVPLDASGSALTTTGTVNLSSGQTIRISPVTGYVSVSE